MAQWAKNPPAVQESWETRVWSLGQEDPLEESMATHSSIFAWRVPWTEDGRLHAVHRVIKSRTQLKPLSMRTRNYARCYLWGKLLEKFIDFICTRMHVSLLLCQSKRFLKNNHGREVCAYYILFHWTFTLPFEGVIFTPNVQTRKTRQSLKHLP